MKNAALVVLFFCTMQLVSSQQAYHPTGMKERYDVKKEITLPVLKSGSLNDDKLAAQNECWQYSLMDGGFFTIGLNNGRFNSPLEKNCQITYGHPYSMTSFAFPIVDGVTYKPYHFLANDANALSISKNALSYSVEIVPDVQATLSMYITINNQAAITFTIENNGSVSHEVGAGILLDAALGKWGDGTLFVNNEAMQSASETWNVQDSLIIFERATSPKGIGISIKAEKTIPDFIKSANWKELYEGNINEMDLYDLAVLYSWYSKTLEPSEKVEYQLVFNLLEPDYAGGEFIRWNLPNALSIEKDMLFPMEIPTKMEVTSDAELSNLTYQVEGQPYVEDYTADEIIQVKGDGNKVNQEVAVNFFENYDSVVTPVTLSLLQNGQVVDQVTRNVFIPAAPYSDEGLDVLIDSIYKTHEQIHLTFSVTNETTEQLLYKIYANNTSLFLNDAEVNEFSLERDNSGRVNEVDIVFILDVTGSMSNEINAVKQNIIEFTDSLSKNGIDYRLGMVTFLDIIENTYDFTDDNALFKSYIADQFAHGGGDYAENSLLALHKGTDFQFRAQAKRIFIWITDAAFHINNSYTSLTKEKVVEALLEKGIQTHCIGNPREQLEYYDQITLNTGGNFYDINGNFRDILLDISRLGESPKFKISFAPSTDISPTDVFKVEIHYAGKGGFDTIQYGEAELQKSLSKESQVGINPMPVNRNSTLTIFKEGTYNVKYQLMNLMGQVIHNGMYTGVEGKRPVDMSDVLRLSENSNQTLLLHVEVYDESNTPIQSQVIKIIR